MYVKRNILLNRHLNIQNINKKNIDNCLVIIDTGSFDISCEFRCFCVFDVLRYFVNGGVRGCR